MMDEFKGTPGPWEAHCFLVVAPMRELVGKCEGCQADLFDTDYVADSEGYRFCWKCFGEMAKDCDLEILE